MFFHILKRDLKRKKTMNIILLIFIILSTIFLASSVNNLWAISGAVDHFIEISKTPDRFILSVTSEENKENDEISKYLKDNQYVSEYEVIDSFNVSNEQLTINMCELNPDKEKYERTNTLSIQVIPGNFMKVFNMDGSKLTLKSGEIAFPKTEAENNDLQIGDRVSIKVGEIEQEFKIAAIVKDAVFGNTMMGFKRLFITEEDFEKYKSHNTLFYTRIYSINYEDEEAFQKDWDAQNYNTIANISKDLVGMCYVMDMLIAGVLIIVSICQILIAFLVLRFTIVFTLQEDYKEIGIMKAIGIKDAGIKGLYLVKYLAISVIGALVGFVLSFSFGNMLLKQAIVNIVVDKAEQNMLINILCAVMVVAVVLLFCYGSTNKLRKYSAMDAIRNGSNGERYHVKNHLKLRKRKRMRPSYYMAVNDIICSLKRFSILAITFCIGTMLILLPLSALNTLKSDEIINLFSLSPSDAYIDNGKTDSYITEKNKDLLMGDLADIEEKLKENGIKGSVGTDIGYTIPCYSNDPKKTYSYLTLQEIGSWERSYSVLEGREPELENEIMVTDITAKEMGVSIGDSVYFNFKDKTEEYIITGTYQSMMNMGNGFRISGNTNIDYEYVSGILCIQVEIEDMESEEACQKLMDIFPNYKVRMAGEFIDTMTGETTKQMNTMMVVITGIVLIINSLITVLMMKTLMTKERGDIALLKSMGFADRSVKVWQTARILIILAAAIAAGTILSNLLAPYIIGPIFAIMGANKVQLVINPLEAYVMYPLLLLTVTAISASICAGEVKKVDLKEVNNME